MLTADKGKKKGKNNGWDDAIQQSYTNVIELKGKSNMLKPTIKSILSYPFYLMMKHLVAWCVDDLIATNQYLVSN